MAADFVHSLRQLHDWVRGLVVAACEERGADGSSLEWPTRVLATSSTRSIALAKRHWSSGSRPPDRSWNRLCSLAKGCRREKSSLPNWYERIRSSLANHRRSDRWHTRIDVPKAACLDSHRCSS